MNPLFRLPLLLSLLLFSLRTVAQSPSFLFTAYSPLKGLASHEVNGVQQDRDGFLWVATNNGLQRFDGVKFKSFRHEEGNPQTIPANNLTRIHIDRDDNLWLVTQKGQLALFDKRRFTARTVPVPVKKSTLGYGADVQFVADAEGNLFLFARGGPLLMYDKRIGTFTTNTVLRLPADWNVGALAQQPGTQKYWIGLAAGGLAIYNRRTGILSYPGHNLEAEPAVDAFGPKQGFRQAFFDRKGRFWFEAWTHGSTVFQYDPSRKAQPLKTFDFNGSLKTYYEVSALMCQRNGRVWASGPALMAYYNEAQERFVVVPSQPGGTTSIEYDEVPQIFEDKEQNLWVSTRSNGLYRFNPGAEVFTSVFHPDRDPNNPKPGNGSVMSFAQLPNGNLLTGVWADGVHQYNQNLEPVPLAVRMPPGQTLRYATVWSMCPSANGKVLWLGAQPGVGRYDLAAGAAEFRLPTALNNRTVRQVVEDPGGNLWLGMHRYGLFRWVNPWRGKDSLVRLPEVKNFTVNKLLVDHRGWVWVATGDEGLFVYESGTGRLRKHIQGADADNSLPGPGITALLEYNDSLVLVANLDRLFVYNSQTNRFSRFTAANFLGDITALEKDNAGFVWASTTNALYRLRPDAKSVLVHNRLSGIAKDRFNLSASGKLRDGRLLFGADNTFVAFDPRKANQYNATLPVYITGLMVGRTELRVDSVRQADLLSLSARNNSLTVDFSPLSFARIYAVQYKIEGVDDDWQVADRNFRIAYPYLPVGRFTLLLRAFNPEGPSPVTALRIRVNPPWYQTWWFYTLVGLLLAAQLWWLDRQRNMRKQTLQKMRTDISDNLHEEVNTALSNINILSEIARLKSDREPHRAKEYLEQIHNKSHNMMVAMDDMLWSLNPANDAMEKTISRIKEFADALMQRHGVLIELLIDKKVERMELNMRLRHEAFLLFKEGLRSLVTAGTRLCIVHLTAEKSRLLFTIEFENEGCDMQQLNNLLHRRDMELRLQALKAKWTVQVHKSRSMFLLQLPVG